VKVVVKVVVKDDVKDDVKGDLKVEVKDIAKSNGLNLKLMQLVLLSSCNYTLVQGHRPLNHHELSVLSIKQLQQLSF